MSHYDPEFYGSIRDGSRRSAQIIAPLIIEMLRPKSVLDVGCGQGVWLNEFARNGTADVHGVDGEYVSKNDLLIPPDRFSAVNLEKGLDLHRCFDLAMSLEVAEHLGADAAENFVASLVRHSACVLFSAAIPYQDGTSHVNEQWPSYWVEKFAAHEYRPWDFRTMLWDDSQIDHWYVQNMLLFIEEGAEADFPGLAEIAQSLPIDLVHPRQYLKTVSEKQDVEKALWDARAELTRLDAVQHIPASRKYILLDDGSFPIDPDSENGAIKRVRELNGLYGGAPADGKEAIAAIEAHRRDGVEFLVQTWLDFWWQRAYAGFTAYLEEEAECLVKNERCRIYRFSEWCSK